MHHITVELLYQEYSLYAESVEVQRGCMMPDISHHRRFLYLSSLSSPCAPPGLPPISQSPVSKSGTARGQRDNHSHNTAAAAAAAAVPTQAINTAGEHLIIYFQPESTMWQNNMARCHHVNLKQPQQLILDIVRLTSSVRPPHFLLLPSSCCLSFVFNEPRFGGLNVCVCANMGSCVCATVKCRSSSSLSAALTAYSRNTNESDINH